MRLIFCLMAVLFLPGCFDRSVYLSYGATNKLGAPVLILEQQAGPFFVGIPVLEQSGSADSSPRRPGSINGTVTLPDPVPIRAVWVEVLTGRAYEAQTEVSRQDIHVRDGQSPLVVVLLPGGAMVVGSDPGPLSDGPERRDLARVCGTRRPDLDRDVSTSAAIEELTGYPKSSFRLDRSLALPPCE